MPPKTRKTKTFSQPVTEIKHDQWGRYLLRHPFADPTLGKYQGWTRASTFAKTLEDTFGLSQWSQRLVAKGVSIRPSLIALASATPFDDKDTFARIVKDAKSAAGGDDKSQLGTALHSFTEVYDATGENTAPSPWDERVASYGELLAHHKVRVITDFTERVVFNTTQELAGRIDRLVEWTDPDTGKTGLYIGDVKTGTDLKYSWSAIAVQLAVYANSSHMLNLETGLWEPLPLINTEKALVFHIPQDVPGTASLYKVNIGRAWAVAVPLAKAVREWRKIRDHHHYHNLVTDQPQPAAVTPPKTRKTRKSAVTPEADMLHRIGEAESRSELKTLYAEGKSSGIWSPRMSALVKARLAELA